MDLSIPMRMWRIRLLLVQLPVLMTSQDLRTLVRSRNILRLGWVLVCSRLVCTNYEGLHCIHFSGCVWCVVFLNRMQRSCTNHRCLSPYYLNIINSPNYLRHMTIYGFDTTHKIKSPTNLHCGNIHRDILQTEDNVWCNSIFCIKCVYMYSII